MEWRKKLWAPHSQPALAQQRISGKCVTPSDGKHSAKRRPPKRAWVYSALLLIAFGELGQEFIFDE
jgi:hypothetical protein